MTGDPFQRCAPKRKETSITGCPIDKEKKKKPNTKKNQQNGTLNLFTALEEPPFVNPCQPSPCGPNAQCQVFNNAPSCSCNPEFIGSPPSCRPECTSNSECSSHLACVNQKCKDPCPGACGLNTACRVVSHTPMCVCDQGYSGDPFTGCEIAERKKDFKSFPETQQPDKCNNSIFVWRI